ncbi:GDA1/CD39 nucleoside phosphatase [Helicosporidium sp. ATCC 50920]|nr:GDA1/CD39 nucleoside phosphatase [Helicosporidium sp. ATCC 50920]|eukprot:KDD73355.1 GDA1/CD39 nucleoside phosphatase [Helicosporidium sp. ATCC 50920]
MTQARRPPSRHSKYKGVAYIAAVPLLVFLMVWAVMPRHGQYDAVRNSSFSRSRLSNEPESSFAVVIDAGSTGSRVHIFKFVRRGSGGPLELEFDKFEQRKPGLSAHSDSPTEAADSLRPLLDLAAETVPPELHRDTPIVVGATAGLRLLPGSKAEDILQAIRVLLKEEYRFAAGADSVSILSGANEGAFAWLTLNYLLGHLGSPEADTVAAIDLGGGSVQEAFALTPLEALAAPDPSYVTALQGNGRAYKVYVHSYLGYGLMAARAGILKEGAREGLEAHPCVLAGHSGTYDYAGESHAMRGRPEGVDGFAACEAVVVRALRQEKQDCKAPALQCTFDGVWGGARTPQAFYISSYFWDRAADAGLLPSEDAIQHLLKPSRFGELAQRACAAGGEADLGREFPRVQEALRPFLCLDLVYVHALLTRGFKVPEEASVTLVKKVEYKREKVEAAWPLGAAINLLG